MKISEINIYQALNEFIDEVRIKVVLLLEKEFGSQWPNKLKESLVPAQQKSWDNLIKNGVKPERAIDFHYLRSIAERNKKIFWPFFDKKTHNLPVWFDEIAYVRHHVAHFITSSLKRSDIEKAWIHMISIAEAFALKELEIKLNTLKSRRTITESEIDKFETFFFDNQSLSEIEDINIPVLKKSIKTEAEVQSEGKEAEESENSRFVGIKTTQDIDLNELSNTDTTVTERILPNKNDSQPKRSYILEKYMVQAAEIAKKREALQKEQLKPESVNNKEENQINTLIINALNKYKKDHPQQNKTFWRLVYNEIGLAIPKISKFLPITNDIEKDFLIIKCLFSGVRVEARKIIFPKKMGKIIFDFENNTVEEKILFKKKRLINFKDIVNKVKDPQNKELTKITFSTTRSIESNSVYLYFRLNFIFTENDKYIYQFKYDLDSNYTILIYYFICLLLSYVCGIELNKLIDRREFKKLAWVSKTVTVEDFS